MLSWLEELEEEDQIRALQCVPSDNPVDLRDYEVTVALDAVWYRAKAEVNLVVWCEDPAQIDKWRLVADVLRDDDFDYWEERFDFTDVFEKHFMYAARYGNHSMFIDDVNNTLVILNKLNEHFLD